jgi:hypothetical protein
VWIQTLRLLYIKYYTHDNNLPLQAPMFLSIDAIHTWSRQAEIRRRLSGLILFNALPWKPCKYCFNIPGDRVFCVNSKHTTTILVLISFFNWNTSLFYIQNIIHILLLNGSSHTVARQSRGRILLQALPWKQVLPWEQALPWKRCKYCLSHYIYVIITCLIIIHWVKNKSLPTQKHLTSKGDDRYIY